MPGKPIRVQWMREQEHTWDHFTPAMVTEVSASLDANGRIVDWNYALWSSSHNERIVNAGRLLPARMLEPPFVPAPSTPMLQPEGGADRNAIPLYALPNQHIVNNFPDDAAADVRDALARRTHQRVGDRKLHGRTRARGRCRSGRIPVAPHGRSSRASGDQARRDALRLAAPPRARNRGVGFAFGKYKNLMAYVAIAVEVSVVPETGQVTLEHAEAAVDAGRSSPDGIRNQIEGGIVQAASWTLYEALKYDTERIRSFDWSSYPILRFSAAPRSVKVHLINRARRSSVRPRRR